ncbi:hypothetical protein B0H67DRAFT_498389 [Lasiosphaeris hirsuta]|uniref:Uncharacterized protein n=1 Tax=Lasiosphaeris hirsuta TaxID=260670 RepID=A0AA40DIU6_9PEZI|nr:hypothetical protein B0H67DRAFT_498389 [Lasiosphaeris hirsuta]
MAHAVPPPTYEDAIHRDWLRVVAPRIPVHYYAKLCLVSKRFYQRFAPLLWNDPIAMRPRWNEDGEAGNWTEVEWFCRFVLGHTNTVRPATRALVKSLDLREFAIDTASFSLSTSSMNINKALAVLSVKFPNLSCILLDDHRQIEVNSLMGNDNGAPLLLSAPGCSTSGFQAFATSPYFRRLIYLDISDMPWENLADFRSWDQDLLSDLRILKMRGLRMNDGVASGIFNSFSNRLWSLDVSRNHLTDRELPVRIQQRAFAEVDSLHSKARFDIEGMLDESREIPTSGAVFPSLQPIEESHWSSTFSHPDRYLADAPVYDGMESPANGTFIRANGLARIKDNSANELKKILSDHQQHPIEYDDVTQSRNVTHLYMNSNRLSTWGVIYLIGLLPNRLEHFECDSMLLDITNDFFPRWLSKMSPSISGLVGAAHIFRPIYSLNLQKLRIHHSLVTQLLSIEAKGLTTMASLWLAETFLLPRTELAYPQTYVPDMNPRLRSLTLTKIPRYSSGPLIKKLTGFLKLASLQERAIQDVRAQTRHGPPVLPGLRHIRLEFEHDPSQELDEMSGDGTQFSFFGDSGWESPLNTSWASAPTDTRQPDANPRRSEPEQRNSESGRLSGTPNVPAMDGHMPNVWRGPDKPSSNPAVREYTHLQTNPRLRRSVEHPTPAHIAAGVPPGVLIYGRAWHAILQPPTMRMPTNAELRSMSDVLAAIKQYRKETKASLEKTQRDAGSHDIPLGAPHFHWTGSLEVSLEDSLAYYTDSRHWR